MNDQIETTPESVTPESVPFEPNTVQTDGSISGACEPIEEEPKVLTLGEYKKLMRQYFTVTRPMVAACGHKINIDSAPRTSCEHCLFAWFNSNGERTNLLDEMFRMPGGKQRMIQEQGIKFVKAFGSFMATIDKMKQEAVSVKPMPEGGVPDQFCVTDAGGDCTSDDPRDMHNVPVYTQPTDEWDKYGSHCRGERSATPVHIEPVQMRTQTFDEWNKEQDEQTA